MVGESVSTFAVSVQSDLLKKPKPNNKTCMPQNMASKGFISYSSKCQQLTLNYTGTLKVSLLSVRKTNTFVKEYKTTKNCQQSVKSFPERFVIMNKCT